MPKEPLLDAQLSLAIATDAVGRARRFYDYKNKDTAYDALVDIHNNLIEQRRKLDALANDIREANNRAEDSL